MRAEIAVSVEGMSLNERRALAQEQAPAIAAATGLTLREVYSMFLSPETS